MSASGSRVLRGVRSALVPAALALLLAGCAAGGPESAATPAVSPLADACGAGSSSTPQAAAADVVTPAELCAADGRAWQSSVFTFVTNSPDWGETTPACDEARKSAYWDAREAVQPAMTTIAIASDRGDDPWSLGTLGVAVISASDPSVPVALLNAEVSACLEGSPQSALSHDAWQGVRGPVPGDYGETYTWWVAGDTSWAFVQAFVSDSLPPADASELEAAFDTVLDVQAGLIGA